MGSKEKNRFEWALNKVVEKMESLGSKKPDIWFSPSDPILINSPNREQIIQLLYELFSKGELISPKYDLEDFKKHFEGDNVKVKGIPWLGQNREIIHLISRLQSKGLVSNINYVKSICEHFYDGRKHRILKPTNLTSLYQRADSTSRVKYIVRRIEELR